MSRPQLDQQSPSSTRHGSVPPVDVSRVPWITEKDRSTALTPMERLDAELCDFVEWIRPSRESHRARMKVVRRFEGIVQSIWATSKVEVFGSLATGLYLPDGDLDIVVSLPSISASSTEAILEEIAHNVLSRGLADEESIEILHSARVPLLKFKTLAADSASSFKLDVSLEHARDGPLGATACLAILQGLDTIGTAKSDRAKGLIFVVKTLLQAKDLASSREGGLGGMSISCLVVSFLQHDRRESKLCSPGSDLLAFLEFATLFDYERYAICVAGKGSIRPKATQRWTFDSKPRRVCIQHPTDLGRNLSCGAYGTHELQRAFGETHGATKSRLESEEPNEAGQSFLAEIFSRAYDPKADLDAPFYDAESSSI
ncbi:uncharacterized protein JCM6883_005050 [Sporobolomyces salmoneus]|uniref:uncharacterized protein n=1 Tax=Sporobolomyces salmoneus TaxID=183962 RepID=UPI003171EA38